MNLKKQIIDKRIQLFCSKLELLPTDMIPMILYAWNVSFADVAGNQEVIAERGLNLLNKNLLLLEELLRTMTESDKIEMNSLGIMTPEKLLLVDNPREASNNSSTEATSVTNNEDNLNLNCRFAATVIDKLVGHVNLEKARARNLAKSKIGGNTKDLLKHMKELNSAGELVRICHTHKLRMDLLTEVRLRRAEIENEENLKRVKKQKQRYDILKAYVVMKKNKTNMERNG